MIPKIKQEDKDPNKSKPSYIEDKDPNKSKICLKQRIIAPNFKQIFDLLEASPLERQLCKKVDFKVNLEAKDHSISSYLLAKHKRRKIKDLLKP